MPFALAERLVPGKTANSPILVILLRAPQKSILAAAGHCMLIQSMVKKVKNPAALERDRHRCKRSRTYRRVCNVRAGYGLVRGGFQ